MFIIGIATFFAVKELGQNRDNQNQPAFPIAPAASSASPTQTDSAGNVKTYTNTEFGFEFQYPENWTFHKNTFGGPFSKFNLVGASPKEKGHPDPISPSLLVNIVAPDFADRTSISLKNLNASTSAVIVAGVKGTKYEYEFENTPQIGIDLPSGEYRLLLGANKKYENIFNQILASFKFLKSSQ